MKSFTPRNYFFRVDDKFFPRFALGDAKLRTGSLLLYVVLFFFSRNSGRCFLSQSELAALCHCSRKTVQTYLAALAELNYIQIENAPQGQVYHLVLSAHVENLLALNGIELGANESGDAQNLRRRCENFTHLLKIKEIKSINPLSPNNSQIHAGQSFSSASREKGFSWQPKPSAQAQLLNAPGAEKEAARENKAVGTEAAFEKLWAAWPVKKEKFAAQKIFDSLRRSGILPSADDLLATVERFRASDSHWLNGYAPKLSNWLKGHCWQDEVFSRPAPGQQGQNVVPAPDPNLVRQVQEIQEKYANRGALFSADASVSSEQYSKQENHEQLAEVDQIASQLAELWHDKTPALIKAFCRSAFQNLKIAPDTILTRAREYLAEGKFPDCSLISWLKKELSSHVSVSADTGEPDAISTRSGQGGVFGVPAGTARNAWEGLLHNRGLRNPQRSGQTEHQFQAIPALPDGSIWQDKNYNDSGHRAAGTKYFDLPKACPPTSLACGYSTAYGTEIRNSHTRERCPRPS